MPVFVTEKNSLVKRIYKPDDFIFLYSNIEH